MRRRSRILCLVVSALLPAGMLLTLPSSAGAAPGTNADRSGPPDTSNYRRLVRSTDLSAAATGAATGAFLRDPVVSNTVANYAATETAGDGEPSIAVNPSNPNEIVIASFNNGGFYRSTDGGNTWTFVSTYTQPPGGGTVPNDQQIDFTRGNVLAASFLDSGRNIYSGTTANAAAQASWNWPLDGLGNAVRVNTTGIGNSDQPWIVSAPRPGNLSQDNIYVAYDDFATGPNMQVAVANAANPPTYGNDTTVGAASLLCCAPGANPGLRLAADSRTGAVYAVWQNTTAGANPDQSFNAQISLNRTTDGGQTWTLNGSATGINVANGASNQRNPKFGTVNALIGGVHHAAVDPVTGDVYVVYACGDGVGGDNPLCLVRVHDDGTGTGTVTTDPPRTITTLHSALPSIAVASNRVIAVLFTSFDGFSVDGFPIFSAHLSMSDDQGATWSDQVLETSLSPVTDNTNNRQRVLGDYQEIMSVGRTFYGTFTGNGAGFGRTVSNMDPIFFKTTAGGAAAAVTGDLNFGTVARGTTATRDVVVQNVGTDPLIVNGVSFTAGSDSAFSVAPAPGVPTTIQPSDSVTYIARFSPPANSTATPRTGTLRVETSDPNNPVTDLPATGTPGVPQAVLAANDLQFGDVPVDDRTAPNASSIVLSVNNTASCQLCDLSLSSLSITGTNESDFSIVGAPTLPASIGAGSHLDLTIKFNPSADGLRTATLTVGTSDPATPSQAVALSGNGLLSNIGALPDTVIFDPTVFDPQCGAVCGVTKSVTVTNTGQAELIVDSVSFSNPVYSGPLQQVPPARVAPNASFTEPVLFRPTATADRSVEGILSLQHNVSGSTIVVQKNVPLCGESVGRGIRVLAIGASGTLHPNIDRLTLQSFGLKRKISVDARNLPLQTISPPTSCQTFSFQYENQALPEAETIGKKSAYYTLKVTVGGATVTQTINLAVNQFKTIVVTVGP